MDQVSFPSEACGPWKQGRKKGGSITSCMDWENEANKMFVTWIFLLFCFGRWTIARGLYGYWRTWNWPATACEISQPYNKEILLTEGIYGNKTTKKMDTYHQCLSYLIFLVWFWRRSTVCEQVASIIQNFLLWNYNLILCMVKMAGKVCWALKYFASISIFLLKNLMTYVCQKKLSNFEVWLQFSLTLLQKLIGCRQIASTNKFDI